MNKLEKTAWGNIGGTILCAIIAGPGIWLMVIFNAKGPMVMVPFWIGGLIGGLVSYLHNIKEWARLDEREKEIATKANALSRCVFILFLYCTSFIIFFVAGAKNPVPAYILPTLFLSGLFLMVFVQSAAILLQFAKERYDE
jgi:hypothetical protein